MTLSKMRILWIPHAGWHIPQRAHLFCRKLSEYHEVHVTDWVADFSHPLDYLSRRYLKNFIYRSCKDGSIYVHGIPRISPALFSSGLRRLNQRVFSHYVQQIIEENQIDVVVGTFVVPPPEAKRLIFDLFDENVAGWRQSGRFNEYADEIAEVEYQYLTTADAVVAASTVLFDKASRAAPDQPVHLIPNGIDLRAYESADGALFRSKIQLDGKLIGMVGTHEKRYEMELVLNAAKLMSDDHVTFLIAGRGSQLAWAEQEARRLKLKNVRFHGHIPFEQLPSVMSALDVGLCAYQKSEMDDARSPMRLFSYLAAGTPAVCTDLTSVRELDMENVVLVHDTPECVVEGIRQALPGARERPRSLCKFDLPHLVNQYEQVLAGQEIPLAYN